MKRSQKSGDTDRAGNGRTRRRFIIAASGLLILLAAGAGIQYAADADEIAKLRRYTPYGHHFIDTALTGGSVEWKSREIAIWRVRRKVRGFDSLAEFKAAFLEDSPHRQASISVHHPALNLNDAEGRASHERAEAILAFLSEQEFGNAGPVSD